MLFRRKPLLHLIYEDEAQIHQNCFVSQLFETLKNRFRISLVSRKKLVDGISPYQAGDLVFCLLKQRNWHKLTPFLARAVEHSGVFIYDQDPWEAYFSQASSPGAYRKLANFVNVRSFLVTSGWWAQHIAKRDKLPVKFVRMGMLPRLCNVGPAYEQRPIEIGFQGTLHPSRSAFFERMRRNGISVQFRESQPYADFLRSIQDFRIFLHSEALPDGTPVNGIWIKDIEASARGLFSIRNEDEDVESYALSEIPTIFTFRNENEIPTILDRISDMSASERNSRIFHAVNRIRDRDDWNTVVEAIHTD